jgi:hypothetical protein
MKPQFIGLDSGVHNSDLLKSGQRIMKGGSWKKQRVVMVIPASESIPTKVYLSHCSLIFPPNQSVYKLAAIGMEVGEAFSNSIAEIINHPDLGQWEYLLTIEHDNIPQNDSLLRLIQRMEDNPQFACIGGLYWTKGEGGVPQIWGDPKDALNFRPQYPDPNGGLVECCGTGMGFNLWRLQMFKDEKLRRPWFKTIADATGVGTQDLYAWSDFRKHGYRCAIDCSVKIGHYDSVADITW